MRTAHEEGLFYATLHGDWQILIHKMCLKSILLSTSAVAISALTERAIACSMLDMVSTDSYCMQHVGHGVNRQLLACSMLDMVSTDRAIACSMLDMVSIASGQCIKRSLPLELYTCKTSLKPSLLNCSQQPYTCWIFVPH